jgi:glycosyltransferase involved in cell wall biosynthesis
MTSSPLRGGDVKSATTLWHRPAVLATAAPQVEIVVPVHNEEAALALSVRRLHRFLLDEFPFSWRIVIADNASTDVTPAEAAALAAELPRVSWLRLEAKGRGRALRAAWSASEARVVCYMDVDLSTDLRALLPLVAPLLSGHSDLAIGSRLAHGARVVRGPKRELISRGYNRLLHTALRARFSDAQCGFKAIRRACSTTCSARSGTTTGSSTPSCSCSPSAAACASTRCLSTGSTTRTRA